MFSEIPLNLRKKINSFGINKLYFIDEIWFKKSKKKMELTNQLHLILELQEDLNFCYQIQIPRCPSLHYKIGFCIVIHAALPLDQPHGQQFQ